MGRKFIVHIINYLLNEIHRGNEVKDQIFQQQQADEEKEKKQQSKILQEEMQQENEMLLKKEFPQKENLIEELQEKNP